MRMLLPWLAWLVVFAIAWGLCWAVTRPPAPCPAGEHRVITLTGKTFLDQCRA